MVGYFNSFDLSNPAVAEYSLKDYDGNVLSTGTLGRDGDKLYVIDSRGGQIDIDLSPLGFILAFVTYNNPAGTIETGPNAGLPYYYLGQTVDYDINLLSLLSWTIGDNGNPFGWFGDPTVTAEMHYAAFDPSTGKVIPGDLMCGSPIFDWQGAIAPGYTKLNDTFYIEGCNHAGLDVTTVRIVAPIFFGIFDIIFFDGIAGIWDPQ